MNNVKKSIGWADYTINPVKGLCPVDCKDNQGKSYCYARAMYKRFKWNPEIRFEPLVLADPFCYSKPARIFVGSTMELFGDWVKPAWLDMIFEFCQRETNKRHTFLFLTKQPQNLPAWSPFPDNCWVGVTATDADMLFDAINHLDDIQCSIRYISLEPLLGNPHLVDLDLHLKSSCDWVIIGAQTQPYKPPKIQWVQEIVEACDKAGIPVFLKDNLKPIFPVTNPFYMQYGVPIYETMLRQELPPETLWRVTGLVK